MDKENGNASKLRIKKVIEKEIKNIPPPSPPRYRHVIIHSNGEEPFSLNILANRFRNHGYIQRKSNKKLAVCLVLVNSLMGILLILLICIFCVQTILNEVEVTLQDSRIIRITEGGGKGEFDQFIKLFINGFIETSIKLIPSNITRNLSYGDTVTLELSIDEKILIVNIRAKFLGITLIEGERYYAIL